MVTAISDAPRALDPWLALLAGDRVWADEDEVPDVRRRVASALAILGLGVVVSLMWMSVIQRIGRGLPLLPSQLAAITATIVSIALAVRPATVLLGRTTTPAAFAPRLVWRGACFVLLVLAIAYQMPGWPAVAGWALGVTVGADVMMSSWALGVDPRPLTWWRRFLLSPLHFGVLGALAAVAIAPGYLPRLWSLIGPYAALHIGLVVAVLTCHALASMSQQLESDLETARRDATSEERRYRAHWLHDDVLAEVRLTNLRLQRGDLDAHGAAAALDDLDHQLRLRQLDELFAAGTIRLADIIQAHVRRTQALGVRFSAMPSLDAAGRRVDEEVGRRFARVIAVLMSNAVNAGASTLALGLETTPEQIIVRLADDAGGFDLPSVPAGRGLDSLADELGVGNLQRIGLPGGSLMIATIVTAAPKGRSTARTNATAKSTATSRTTATSRATATSRTTATTTTTTTTTGDPT